MAGHTPIETWAALCTVDYKDGKTLKTCFSEFSRISLVWLFFCYDVCILGFIVKFLYINICRNKKYSYLCTAA